MGDKEEKEEGEEGETKVHNLMEFTGGCEGESLKEKEEQKNIKPVMSADSVDCIKN